MSDFQLRTPSLQLPRASGPSLGNFALQLDPQLQAEIRALLDNAPSQRLRGLFSHPEWRRLQQAELDRILRQPPFTPTPAFTPGAGPAQARAADVSDFLAALTAVPAVRAAMNRVLDQALTPLRRGIDDLTPAQAALLITHAVVMAGSLVTAINLQDNPPPFPLALILNRNIPVPGVDGLAVQIRHRGGGASWSDIGGSGVSVQGQAASVGGQFRGSAGASVSNIAGSGVSVRGGIGNQDGRFQGDFFITLDVNRWIEMAR